MASNCIRINQCDKTVTLHAMHGYVNRSHTVSDSVFLGLFRDTTSDPWQWTDSNVTSSIDQYWISNPLSGSQLCATLWYLGVYQEPCSSTRSYMCKTKAAGKVFVILFS